MSYVTKNLMLNEEIIYTAKIHWMIYLWGLMVLSIGASLVLFGVSSNSSLLGNILKVIGFLLVALAAFNLLTAFIHIKTTELAITNKRVIAKFGFIARVTKEINFNRVEGLSVHQSILERLLNSGTIIVRGIGGNDTPIPYIDNPLEFRTKAMEIIDKGNE